MELTKKVFTVFVLVLFVAYSGGVGFSVHNCEHCQQQKVYFFHHPDCCSAAAEEHHNQADNCEHKQDICCNHPEKETSKNGKNTDTPHCHPCCVTEYQFYKIQGNYIAPHCEKLVTISNFLLFSELLPLQWQPNLTEKINFSDNNPYPPPLQAGGERFIVFIQKLLFYA